MSSAYGYWYLGDGFYEDLGVARNASEDVIKKAYRKLSRRYHPDIDPEKFSEDEIKVRERIFKNIAYAYGELSDPEKRSFYDLVGETILKQQVAEERERIKREEANNGEDETIRAQEAAERLREEQARRRQEQERLRREAQERKEREKREREVREAAEREREAQEERLRDPLKDQIHRLREEKAATEGRQGRILNTKVEFTRRAERRREGHITEEINRFRREGSPSNSSGENKE